MADDEDWHAYPSGLEVKGRHRSRIVDGVDTVTGERIGPDDLNPEEAEARSAEHRRQRARSIFTDPIWPIGRVVSWIGYRDIEAIEERFAPALYKESRPVVEGIPRIVLLRALQEGRLRAIRHHGKLVDRIHPDEWAHVQRGWSIDHWHECLFARSEVIALWPEVKRPALIGAEAEATGAPTPAVNAEPEVLDNPIPKAGREKDEFALSLNNGPASRQKATDQYIIDIIKHIPLDPPLKEKDLINTVKELIAADGKYASRNSIYAQRRHYPAARNRGDHAATLASHRIDKSDDGKSDTN